MYTQSEDISLIRARKVWAKLKSRITCVKSGVSENYHFIQLHHKIYVFQVFKESESVHLYLLETEDAQAQIAKYDHYTAYIEDGEQYDEANLGNDMRRLAANVLGLEIPAK